MNFKELLGLFYVYDYCTRTHGQEYELEIIAVPKDKTEFIFQTTISGNFGSSGTIWKGNCTLINDQLILKAVEENDWSFTAVQDEKEENIYKIFKTYNVEIINENGNILLILKFYERTIKLIKLNKNIDKDKLYSIIYWISHEIRNLHNLRGDNLEFEPSRFWRISDLLLKSYREIKINGNKTIEIICEYDLEFVKEEKRVIENDEILGEHHISRFFFNDKLKFLKHESLK